MSQEVVIIGGVANKPANLAQFKLLGSLLSESSSLHYINGAHLEDGQLQVTSSTEQFEETDAIVEKKPGTDFLIIAHSMGSIAAVKTVAKHPDRTRGVLIAPPLPSPIDLYYHRRSQAKMQEVDGRRVLPSYSFALGENGPSDILPKPANVLMPDSYIDDLVSHSGTFQDEVKSLASKGLLKLVVPKQDWNTAILEATTSIPGIISLDSTHSLHGSQSEMERNCHYLADVIR
jgi:pimeloyl-ACP methyl ester carboxylesterase